MESAELIEILEYCCLLSDQSFLTTFWVPFVYQMSSSAWQIANERLTDQKIQNKDTTQSWSSSVVVWFLQGKSMLALTGGDVGPRLKVTSRYGESPYLRGLCCLRSFCSFCFCQWNNWRSMSKQTTKKLSVCQERVQERKMKRAVGPENQKIGSYSNPSEQMTYRLLFYGNE